jgi:hypothetical protein
MNSPGLNGIARTAGTMVLVGSIVTVAGSAAHARPWEPIETVFDADEAAYRQGALVLPSFGLVAPDQNDKTHGARAGFRMGAILGWHLSPRFSLNGELNLAVLRFKADTAFTLGGETDGLLFDYALSPLFHIGSRSLEVVVGPKVGRFRYALDDNDPQSLSRSTGWSYGVNLGVFAPLQTMAIGGVVSYTSGHATELCDSTCHGRTSNIGDLRVVAVSFAMLY